MTDEIKVPQVTARRRLRLAVVGTGLGSAPHFASLRDLAGEAEIAWVVSRSATGLARAPVPPQTKRTTRLQEALDDPGLDAVLVLTPPASHHEVGCLAAAAGKHVLVEKPLGIDALRAMQLVHACERAGVRLGVMLQHRLREGPLALADLVQSGRLGAFVGGSASVRWWRPQAYYDEPGRGTLARDGGGVLLTQAIHTLDLLLHVTGMPVRVTGSVSTSPIHRMECEDTATALLHYPSGAVAVLRATTAAHPGFPERIELDFTRGSATLVAGELQACLQDGTQARAGAAQGGGGADPMDFGHTSHRAVLQDFMHAVRSGVEPQVTGRSALGVQQVIEAVIRSSREGRAVELAGG